MAADPSTPQLPDLHTTAGRLAQLRHKVDESIHAGPAARRREAARPWQGDGPRADRRAPRRRLVRRARRARPAPHDELRTGEPAALRRRRRDGVRHRRRPADLCVLPGLHGLRRQPRRGLRREDRQGHGPGDADRLPGRRHQRLRRCPHPGGRRGPRALRGDLQAQRARVGRGPADLAGHGSVRRRGGVLPRASPTSS